MKLKPGPAIGLTTIALMLPAAADVIYSNLRNIAIPATYAGIYLDVDGSNGWNADMFNPVAGWDINPFFGGQTVANSPGFQPVRSGTGSMDPIVNLATGASIGGGSVFSTFSWDHDSNPMTPAVPGYGGSQTHLGNGAGQFAAGSEGYFGLKLNDNYGWMRVVLGGATPVIKDWAYDTSGGSGSIVTGNVLQDGTTVTLDSTGGSFTLGSQITGSNNIVKTGANSATLTGSNSHTGTTAVASGTLRVNGSITGSGAVTVDGGATLGGSGSIAGAVNVSGVLAPGASVGTFASGTLSMTTGSTFTFEATDNSASGADLMVVNGPLALTGVTLDLTAANLGLSTWDIGDKLTLISYTGTGITSGFTGLSNNTTYTGGAFGSNMWLLNYNDAIRGGNFPDAATGSQFVTFTRVPESRPILLASLGLLSLLCRRRDRSTARMTR